MSTRFPLLITFVLLAFSLPAAADSGIAVRPESGGAIRQLPDCDRLRDCPETDLSGKHDRGRPPRKSTIPDRHALPESGIARKERPQLPAFRYDPPRAEDLGHFRITCSQGISILKSSGFSDIRIDDCEGNYFNFSAIRDDYRYAVSVYAQGGRIVSIIPY
jgi:hypothetical protein